MMELESSLSANCGASQSRDSEVSITFQLIDIFLAILQGELVEKYSTVCHPKLFVLIGSLLPQPRTMCLRGQQKH
jgi:hypothetical protein